MSADVRPLVEQIARTRAELADALGDPGLPSDRARYAAVSKRWADLSEAFELAALWEDAAGREAEAEALLAEGDDDEVRSLLADARAELDDLAPRIREAMIEPDPDDDRNTIVEIRAGTGRRGGRPVRARPARHLHPLRRVAGLQGRAAVGERGRRRGASRGDRGA